MVAVDSVFFTTGDVKVEKKDKGTQHNNNCDT